MNDLGLCFVKKAKEKYGDKYDYSKVNYINNRTKVCIICPEHGEFWQTPHNHLHFEGCNICSKNKQIKKRNNGDDFEKLSILKHGNKYDYSKVEYVNNKTKVCIICHEKDAYGREHGEFWQTPKAHYLRGDGCPKCNLKVIDTEDFIIQAKQVHGDKYDYSRAIVDGRNKVCIICPEHGEFWQSIKHHLNGHGCKECGKKSISVKNRKTLNDFIPLFNEIHNFKYDYSKAQYLGNHEKIEIICPQHGIFWQTVHDHADGHGCPKCGVLISKGEDEIYCFLKQFYKQEDILRNDRKILDGKEIDILIPSERIGIEYNGVEWHSEKYGKGKYYHLNKTLLGEKKGIRLLHIFEDDFLEKKEIIFEKLKNILKLNKNKVVIGGRKCSISIINYYDAKRFLNKFHIQGCAHSTLYYAAKYNEEVVAVMSFKKYKNDNWELNRFATNFKYRLPGVAMKIFKHFLKENNVVSVKSFLDKTWLHTEDNLYIKMGFKKDGETPPDYTYLIGRKRYHKFNFRKEILHKKYGLPLTMTESEMCEKIGVHRVYNCGLIKYIWKNDTL